jgi:hypothetical protein
MCILGYFLLKLRQALEKNSIPRCRKFFDQPLREWLMSSGGVAAMAACQKVAWRVVVLAGGARIEMVERKVLADAAV